MARGGSAYQQRILDKARLTSKPSLQVFTQQLPKRNARGADSVADLLQQHDAIAADPLRQPHATLTQGVSRKAIVEHLRTIHIPV